MNQPLPIEAALSQAAQSLHAAFQRFPEFEEISLESVLVEHPTDEGDTVRSVEPFLMARRADGRWLSFEDNEEVGAMNGLIDWSHQVRAVVLRATRWGPPLVFEREQMTVEAIERRLGEGVRHVPGAPGLSIG